MSDKLTLTLGLRFDYQSARTEVNNQYSTFDATTPNPGAGNIPGAIIFAGDGPGLRRNADVREPAEGRVGAAHRRRPIASTTGARSAAATVSTTRTSRSISSSGSRPSDSRITRWRANTTNGIQPAFLLDQGFPASAIQQPPFIDPTIGLGTAAHCGGEGWTDAAALPELVHHVRAPVDQQHDGGRVVHRQPRQPFEPSLADIGRRREHEFAKRAGAGNARPAVGYQL